MPNYGQTKVQPGDVYERLTVLKRAGYQRHYILWLCQCKCGVQVVVRGTNLLNGNTGSCGCKLKGRRCVISEEFLHHWYYTTIHTCPTCGKKWQTKKRHYNSRPKEALQRRAYETHNCVNCC